MAAHSIFQVDAFTDKVFKGNPAGVCPIYGWLAEESLGNMVFEFCCIDVGSDAGFMGGVL